METINLYGENGICIYVTSQGFKTDKRDIRFTGAAYKVIGREIYASTTEDAERSILTEFHRRNPAILKAYNDAYGFSADEVEN